MNYNNSLLGNIIIVRNLIFHTSSLGMKQVDHAWKKGRPCLLLYTDDNYDYVLPLTHGVNYDLFGYHYYSLNESKFLYLRKRVFIYDIDSKKNNSLNGYINLEGVYKIPIFGHTEIAKLSFKAYDELVDKFMSLHNISDLSVLSEGKQLILKR
jgi:hypothetical protein